MAVLADRNAGFQGSVDTAQWAQLVSAGMGARWSVLAHPGASVLAGGSLEVTQGTGDRGLRVGAGRAVGDGVLSDWGTSTSLVGDVVGSGTRWDTVVARRDWQTSTATLHVESGGSAKALASGVRLDAPGQDVSDQPLALARFASNSTVVQQIIDLRTWVGAGGGLHAASTEVLAFLGDVGTHVTIGSGANAVIYARTITPGGSAEWSQIQVPTDTGWINATRGSGGLDTQGWRSGRGWRIGEGLYRRIGDVASIRGVVERTGARLPVPTGGDMENVTVLDSIPGPVRTTWAQGLGPGDGGRAYFYTVTPGGQLRMNQAVAGDITAGTFVTFSGTYFV